MYGLSLTSFSVRSCIAPSFTLGQQQTRTVITGGKADAQGPQRGGALRYMEGSAPRPVAPPSPMGSDAAGTLLMAG